MKNVTTDSNVPVPKPVLMLLRPFQEFTQTSASSGVLLFACTLLALFWSNSPWADSYFRLWDSKLTITIAGFSLSKSILLWIDDGLMSVFFFVVGLEIKREILAGELSSLNNAVLPIAAAFGGMVIPAGIYYAINNTPPASTGWGIPMATDIAFALGVLALLGERVPVRLKIFLTALAIVDDIGAVMVIALFYTAQLSWPSLLIGGVFWAMMILSNRLGIRSPLVYALLGIGLWIGLLKSGIHATIAGVLGALTIPARASIDTGAFLLRGHRLLGVVEKNHLPSPLGLINEAQQSAIAALENACEQVQPPLQRLEQALHPWVTFAIMPIFALANAGVSMSGDILGVITSRVSMGIIGGLVLGKVIGVALFSWLAVRSRFAVLPPGVNWNHIVGAGCLAGIGFTMSLFIAGLAFENSSLLLTARLGILVASVIAGIIGWVILARTLPPIMNPKAYPKIISANTRISQ